MVPTRVTPQLCLFPAVMAANSPEGGEACPSPSHPQQTTLSDVVMPEMGGPQLAAEMRACGLLTPLALISGDAPGLNENEAEGAELPRITKPFSLSQLLGFVAQQLGPEVNPPA